MTISEELSIKNINNILKLENKIDSVIEDCIKENGVKMVFWSCICIRI